MRPCVTCIYHKSRTNVDVCDKLQKKTHRMYEVGLFSSFLCDSCIAGKSLQFFKLRIPCVYHKSRTNVDVRDKLQKKTHRMYEVGLFSTFLCDSYIAGKSQQFFKLKHDKLYSSLISIVHYYFHIFLFRLQKY